MRADSEAVSVADHNEPTPSRLAVEVGELRGSVLAVDRKVDDLRAGMSKLTDAMTSVVRLEVQHQQVSLNTTVTREKVESLERRTEAVERLMPGLVETRSWVIRWVLSVVAAALVAVGALVVKLT